MGLWKGVRLEAFDVLRLIRVSTVALYGTTRLVIFPRGNVSMSLICIICPDVSVSQWRVQIELHVQAVQAMQGQVSLSLPELLSQRTLQAQFVPGTTKNTFVLHVNTVLVTGLHSGGGGY